METEKLYDIIDDDDIRLDYFSLPENKSLSVKFGKQYYIAIDPQEIHTSAEERVCLAHELGHCKTNSFYNLYSPLDLRSKHEYRANKWAVARLVPRKEFNRAKKNGYNDVFSLAEYFNVTEDFMRKAIEIYNAS